MDTSVPNPVNPPLKQCTRCKQFFPATSEYFHKVKALSNGFRPQCRMCRSEIARESRKEKRPDTAPQGYKRCGKCKEIKLATTEYFSPAKRCSYGVASYCKECTNRYSRERNAAKRKPKDVIPEGFKKCTICKQALPATSEHFTVRRDTSSGLDPQCRVCKNAGQREKTAKKRLPSDIPDGYKKCTKCKELKLATIENFEKHPTAKHGLRAVCKICRRKENNLYREAHKEEHKAYIRQYEMINKDRIRERKKKYSIENRERRRMYERMYEAINRDKIYEKKKEYRQTHREHLRAWQHNHRALRKSIPGKHTPEQIQDQMKRQKHKCYYCQKKFEKINGQYRYHLEHLVPVTRDGSSNGPDNLVLACPSCNHKKGNKLPHEWPEGGRLC